MTQNTTPRRRLGTTDLLVHPLCLGGNVFGWTASEADSFAVLDAYADAGGNFIDTADVYSAWIPGNAGGESETIIGRWMASRGRTHDTIVATKVGSHAAAKGLSAASIRAGAEASLRRLGVDRIDLYFAHLDDANTPLEETLRAFDGLVREGKVRYIAASNYTAARLTEALGVCSREGLARYLVLQPHYNLVHRQDFEGPLQDLCVREGIACVPYFALAMGFLTGKYRPGTTVESPRAQGAAQYLTDRGLQVLAALDDIAAAHQTTAAAVALTWLRDQPAVVAPIASARTPAQLADLLPMATLTLTAAERQRLSDAG